MKVKAAFRILYYQKYLGFFLIAIGLPIFIFSDSQHSELPLMIGLYTLFTSMEKVEDERSISIRMSSFFAGFILSYTVKILIDTLSSRQLISFVLADIDHFIILTLSLSLMVYYTRLYLIKS